MKAGSIGKDIMQVIGIGLLITLLLTIVSIVVSQVITSGRPGAVNIAAIIPTSPPPTATPTEIPCTAQEWWTAHAAGAGEILDAARKTTLATKVPDIQKAELALKQWQITFEADAAPPCADAAKTAVLNAGKTADD